MKILVACENGFDNSIVGWHDKNIMPAHIKYPVINGLKECGTCHEFKPIDQFLRAKNHYQSYCIPCRRKYAAAYRANPETKQKMLDYTRSYRAKPNNKERLNEKTRIWRATPKAKLQKNATRKAWTSREKQKSVAYKGGKCQGCGYSSCLAALEFHHLDPSEKEIIWSHWGFERNKKELDKCVLVCANCHREIHAGVRSI